MYFPNLGQAPGLPPTTTRRALTLVRFWFFSNTFCCQTWYWKLTPTPHQLENRQSGHNDDFCSKRKHFCFLKPTVTFYVKLRSLMATDAAEDALLFAQAAFWGLLLATAAQLRFIFLLPVRCHWTILDWLLVFSLPPYTWGEKTAWSWVRKEPF